MSKGAKAILEEARKNGEPYYEKVSPEEYPFGVKGEEESGVEERPCTCGSGVHWAFCQENSPYCG